MAESSKEPSRIQRSGRSWLRPAWWWRSTSLDPDALVIVDLPNKSVSAGGAGSPTPSATMAMTADVGNAYWQGKVNLPMAMAKRKIKVDGNVASLLKLAPLGKKLYGGYIQQLQDDGRDDLIA